MTLKAILAYSNISVPLFPLNCHFFVANIDHNQIPYRPEREVRNASSHAATHIHIAISTRQSSHRCSSVSSISPRQIESLRLLSTTYGLPRHAKDGCISYLPTSMTRYSRLRYSSRTTPTLPHRQINTRIVIDTDIDISKPAPLNNPRQMPKQQPLIWTALEETSKNLHKNKEYLVTDEPGEHKAERICRKLQVNVLEPAIRRLVVPWPHNNAESTEICIIWHPPAMSHEWQDVRGTNQALRLRYCSPLPGTIDKAPRLSSLNLPGDCILRCHQRSGACPTVCACRDCALFHCHRKSPPAQTTNQAYVSHAPLLNDPSQNQHEEFIDAVSSTVTSVMPASCPDKAGHQNGERSRSRD